MSMEICDCYKLLELPECAPNEEITSAFKRLAHKYHPDKNPDRVQWATRVMCDLNIAYTTILSQRFGDANVNGNKYYDDKETEKGFKETQKEEPEIEDDVKFEILTEQFVKIRESAKEALYRYFQYGLDNLVQREQISNRAQFNNVAFSLRKCYHTLMNLAKQTNDEEFIEHFDIFGRMIFNFYKSSECLNILDSYDNIIDVEAYRMYKNGDDALHYSHKEIFYDRHNRGYFKRDYATLLISEAEYYFINTLKIYPTSTWALETKIKLEYATSLKEYIDLFFSQ
ncbi:MAG: DnaJ domain-containing protein [Spirochaetota bacterium]|nr:DnaJ domain-containing protein [Spirochaetota bacterium]